MAKALENVDTNKVFAWGASFGSTPALALSVLEPSLNLAGVIALRPSHLVWTSRAAGFVRDSDRESYVDDSFWTFKGKDLPYIPMFGPKGEGAQTLHDQALLSERGDPVQSPGRYSPVFENTGLPVYQFGTSWQFYRAKAQEILGADAMKYRRIPVENIEVPVFLAAGGNDLIWPANEYVDEMNQLISKDLLTSITVACAGHGTAIPGRATMDSTHFLFSNGLQDSPEWSSDGGTPFFNHQADLKVHRLLHRFLKSMIYMNLRFQIISISRVIAGEAN